MVARVMMVTAIQPFVSNRSATENQTATMPCTSNRPRTGRPKISSAKDVSASRATPNNTETGSVTGRKAHDVNMPNTMPSPPVRGTGIVCRERGLGWSSILRTLLLINHQIKVKVTVNAINGAITGEKAGSAIMLLNYSCREYHAAISTSMRISCTRETRETVSSSRKLSATHTIL